MDVNELAVQKADHPSEPVVMQPPRRLSRRAQLMLVLVAFAGLGLWMLIGSLSSNPSTPPVAAPQPAASDSFTPTADQWAGFRTAPVQLRAFSSSVMADGKISADDDLTTTVYSSYTGRVTKLFVKAGDTVKVGDPLLAMQAVEFVQAANDLVTARSNERTTKAQLGLAIATEKRQHELYLIQGSALKDWQQSQADLANARGSFAGAEVALGAVRGRLRILGKSDSAIGAMEASLDPTRFSPETVIPAPINGTVIQRQVGVGQNIATQGNGGSTSIFTIGNVSRVWLVANMREVDAPKLHIGDVMEVSVLALPQQSFRATITFVAASIDPVTHRLPIHAEIANPLGLLKPEMFASFRVISGEAASAPAIPADAIVYDPDGAHVWLVGPNRTLSVRKVTLGRTEDKLAEVVSGLRAGDVVVTSGSVFIDRAAEAQ